MITHEMLVETIYRDDHFETCNDDCNNDIPCEKCCEHMVTEYEDAIRADERKKFAFWLINRIHRNSLQRILSETKDFDIMGIDNILSIYEKEQKDERNER